MEMEKNEIEIRFLTFMFYFLNTRNVLNGGNFSIQSNSSKAHENADTSLHYSLLPPLDKQQVHTVDPPFLLHRHQFLGACGMDSNAGVEIAFAGAHLDGDAEAL